MRCPTTFLDDTNNLTFAIADTAWSEVRNDENTEVDWALVAADKSDGPKSTKVITLLKGSGGIEKCAASLPKDGTIVYGGARLASNRFVSFIFIDEDLTPAMAKGRAIMFKNGVLNVFEGCDCEIEMRRDLTEHEVLLHIEKVTGFAIPGASKPRSEVPVIKSSNKKTVNPPEAAKINPAPISANVKPTTTSQPKPLQTNGLQMASGVQVQPDVVKCEFMVLLRAYLLSMKSDDAIFVGAIIIFLFLKVRCHCRSNDLETCHLF